MRKFFTAASVAIAFCGVALSPAVNAATYGAPAITSIAVGGSGEVYIRFTNLPNPGACGSNNDWVTIPAANETMKALAMSLYFNARPIQVETAGCNGPYETVTGLYSPGG